MGQKYRTAIVDVKNGCEFKIFHANGHLICASHQGYVNRKDCERALDNLLQAIREDLIDTNHKPKKAESLPLLDVFTLSDGAASITGKIAYIKREEEAENDGDLPGLRGESEEPESEDRQ